MGSSCLKWNAFSTTVSQARTGASSSSSGISSAGRGAGIRILNCLWHSGHSNTKLRPGSYWVSSKSMASSHFGQRMRFIVLCRVDYFLSTHASL